MSRRIVIAGGGIAGLYAAKAARDQDPDCSISILEAGSHNTYVRTRLPEYISGEASLEELFPYNDSWYAANRIVLEKNVSIKGIDTASKTVATNAGIQQYDSLVLALGSSGNIPPIPGTNLENCFPVRTLDDADRIKRLSGRDKTCTIIGGGLLGLEMAWAIKQLGCNVNVVEGSPRLLPRQIDEQGAQLLLDAISAKGLKLYLEAQVQEIGGTGKAEYVKLKDGTKINTDFVILSTGVKANTQALSESGINLGRAVIVDEYMRTSAEGVYAAGDIAEHNGKNFCIWPISVAQGKIAGANAAGGELKYTDINPFTSLKIKGITMFSIGDVFSTDAIVKTELDIAVGKYIKLFIKDSVITGAIIFGEPNLPLKVKKAVEQRKKLPETSGSFGIKELIESL